MKLHNRRNVRKIWPTEREKEREGKDNPSSSRGLPMKKLF